MQKLNDIYFQWTMVIDYLHISVIFTIDLTKRLHNDKIFLKPRRKEKNQISLKKNKHFVCRPGKLKKKKFNFLNKVNDLVVKNIE